MFVKKQKVSIVVPNTDNEGISLECECKALCSALTDLAGGCSVIDSWGNGKTRTVHYTMAQAK